MLEVEHLDVRIASAEVLHDINLHVNEGELVGIIGPNGAGKSTLLNAIAGLVRPAVGTVRVGGEDWTSLADHRRARGGLAYVPDGRGLVPALTVRENLALPGSPLDPEVETEVDEMLPSLRARWDVPLGSLSGGEQQVVALLRALRPSARLVLLDEPTLGLAPEVVNRTAALLRRHARRGRAALIVEQNARFCLDLCDRVLLLGRGRIMREVGAGANVDLAEYLGTAAVASAGTELPRPTGKTDMEDT